MLLIDCTEDNQFITWKAPTLEPQESTDKLDVDLSSPSTALEWRHWRATFENFLAALPLNVVDGKALLINRCRQGSSLPQREPVRRKMPRRR
ncbi:hypothetical protein M514_13541 [Trichuris suis]|uniref:Uncharacterized protein n=1 Tax=Trichuris suis TaxID=68888 RepID=A0A085N5F9_9BILA|nr:hypothetical protein M513_13541 [Trichuris suis]KFD64705.1 hypothetical protein M514_13541 [Trichuris suis]